MGRFRFVALFGIALAVAGSPLRAQLWAGSPHDIWFAVGRLAVRWDGHALTEVPFGLSEEASIASLWGSGPDNVFAVGSGGTILRWDGRSWTRMASPTDRDLAVVRGRSAADVFAVSTSDAEDQRPLLLHFDGRTWSTGELPLALRPAGLIVTATDITVVGRVPGDPPPPRRQTPGVLAAYAAGHWTVRGWDGRRANDSLLAAAWWGSVSQAGSATLLIGEREVRRPDGEEENFAAIALHSAGAWRWLPRVESALPVAEDASMAASTAFLAGDGTPIALRDGMGFARFSGGRWMAVGVNTRMPEAPTAPAAAQVAPKSGKEARSGPRPTGLPLPAGAAAAPRAAGAPNEPAPAADPGAASAAAIAFDMTGASEAWGPSATDFWVSTLGGRIIHVTGDTPVLVYDSHCSESAYATRFLWCQVLRPPAR